MTTTARCIAAIPQTRDVSLFHFELPGAKPDIGQHITLSGFNQGYHCEGTYTVIDRQVDGSVTVAVKHTRRGGLADLLHAGVRELQYEGYAGLALPRGKKMLLICGGIGVTPALALLRRKAQHYPDSELHIILSAETLADLPFLAELLQYHIEDNHIRLDIFLTRQTLNRQHAPFHQGRLSAEALHKLCPDLNDHAVHIYGSNAFSGAVKSMVNALREAKSSQPNCAGLLVVGEREIRHDGQTSVLDLLEKAALPIKSRCRMGICGTCRVKLRSGHVASDDDSILSQIDKDQGIVLACCSIPQGDASIELMA